MLIWIMVDMVDDLVFFQFILKVPLPKTGQAMEYLLPTSRLFTTRFMEKNLKCMRYNDFYAVFSIINCKFAFEKSSKIQRSYD